MLGDRKGNARWQIESGLKCQLYCLFFLKLFIFIFTFGYAGSLLLHRLSLIVKRGLLSNCGAQASYCGSFSLAVSTAVWCVGSVVVANGLVACSVWNFPGPGIEPVSPGLQGIF